MRAEPDTANEHGNTPLHYAAFWNHTGICEVKGQQHIEIYVYASTYYVCAIGGCLYILYLYL